jgi:hypothetical protein
MSFVFGNICCDNDDDAIFEGLVVCNIYAYCYIYIHHIYVTTGRALNELKQGFFFSLCDSEERVSMEM